MSDRFRGCLLGGAVGDALGAPVEFTPLSTILRRYGERGIRDLDRAYGRVGAITDDTQMTLWTAEGLLRFEAGRRADESASVADFVRRAYYRWLDTQGLPVPRSDVPLDGGWLEGVGALRARRSPGRTCLDALSSGNWGRPDASVNDSKGCGTVMRIAPVGLRMPPGEAFRTGADLSALTHGHPSGYLAGGFLAEVISRLVGGDGLGSAVGSSLSELRRWEGHEEVETAVMAAVSLAREGHPSAEAIEALGGAWVAEEALAIALYCALVHIDDFEAGVVLAVNHSGDADSTGAIAGNLLGLLNGVDAIPERWLEPLELREEIAAVADDLVTGWADGAEWQRRYPGW